MSGRSSDQILSEAAELLRTAQFGLEDMRTRPERAKTGLRNAVVFGRMVTFALQNLRSASPDFGDWYDQRQTEMKADPLMRYFHDLRTTIEKQARTPTSTSAYIRSFSTSDLNRFKPAPPGATSFFIGDQNGGSGWIVETPAGQEKYYVELPPDIGEVHLHLHLETHPSLGDLATEPAHVLVGRYLDSVALLLTDAMQRFG